LVETAPVEAKAAARSPAVDLHAAVAALINGILAGGNSVRRK
jgi:hypothetical protein